ncbi:MAG: tandem-95 repeat protein [Sphingomonadaceae bacterium]|nr:tandem-95 repeat protein [Sphingomonadaceae bacterium]
MGESGALRTRRPLDSRSLPQLWAPGDITPLGSETLVNGAAAGAQKGASIAMLEGGGRAIVWSAPDANNDGIFARLFDADGTPIGPEFAVNTSTPGAQASPAIAALEGGGFVVTWNTPVAGVSEVHARLFGSDGAPLTAEFEIDPGETVNCLNAAPAALPGGGFVIVWQVGGDSRVQRYDASGWAVGAEHALAVASECSATVLDDGYVVTYKGLDGGTDGFGIRAQLFAADGSAIGSAIAVNEHKPGAQQASSVCALEDNRFVVTWTSLGQDGPGSEGGVYARVFASDGSPASGEFRVNVVTAGSQANASASAQPGGGFVVTWMSAGQDGGGQGVYARAFDAGGVALGGEFRVNETTTGDQSLAARARSIATDGEGALWMVWNGNGVGDPDGVFTRRFSVDLNRAPVALDDVASVAEDGSVAIDARANDSDPDGDPLTIAALGAAAHGAVSIDETGAILYTPDADYAGSDSFSYTLSDGRGGEASATVFVTITPVNESPVAGDDDAVVTEDETVNIAVLANDGDEDDGTLTVASVGAAAHGAVTLNPDGSIGYAPDPDYVGLDSFEYTLSDGQGGTDTATVSITVEAYPGVALAGGSSDDLLTGGAGDDTIDGRDGADTLLGLANADRLIGGQGRDSIEGGSGDDTLEGRKSNDVLLGGSGANLLLGAQGEDAIYGGAERDTIDGGSHADVGSGGEGDDVLRGVTGNDTLLGGDGADAIKGGPGADSIDGGAGDDFIVGETGADSLAGGAGLDRFAFKSGHADATDTIVDFASGEDKIDVARIDADAGQPGRQAFAFTGAADTGAVATLFVLDQGGGSWLVGAHTDGDGVVDFTLLVIGDAPLASDFIGIA